MTKNVRRRERTWLSLNVSSANGEFEGIYEFSKRGQPSKAVDHGTDCPLMARMKALYHHWWPVFERIWWSVVPGPQQKSNKSESRKVTASEAKPKFIPPRRSAAVWSISLIKVQTIRCGQHWNSAKARLYTATSLLVNYSDCRDSRIIHPCLHIIVNCPQGAPMLLPGPWGLRFPFPGYLGICVWCLVPSWSMITVSPNQACIIYEKLEYCGVLLTVGYIHSSALEPNFWSRGFRSTTPRYR